MAKHDETVDRRAPSGTLIITTVSFASPDERNNAAGFAGEVNSLQPGRTHTIATRLPLQLKVRNGQGGFNVPRVDSSAKLNLNSPVQEIALRTCKRSDANKACEAGY